MQTLEEIKEELNKGFNDAFLFGTERFYIDSNGIKNIPVVEGIDKDTKFKIIPLEVKYMEILYVHHNLSCDIVSFYDQNGNCILSVEDTMDNNILDAINRLYSPFKKESQGKELEPEIEYMNKEDREKLSL